MKNESWPARNVHLWLSNDEGLYNLVEFALKEARNKDEAARLILTFLPDRTPDGIHKYTFSTVRAALNGW